MSWKVIFEFLISDILTASTISGVFMFISNRHAEKLEKQNNQNLQSLTDHMDLRMEIIEQKLENAIMKIKL